MPHRLNTNRQFMIGNGLLAFAVIGVVVTFTFLSLYRGRGADRERGRAGCYIFSFAPSVAGDTLALYLNDSLLGHVSGVTDTLRLRVHRFAEHSALLVVDESTDLLSVFPLEGEGIYRLEKAGGKYRLCPAE